MADPYHRYGAPPERGSLVKSNFPGYLSSEAPWLLSNQTFALTDLRTYSLDFMNRDKLLKSVPYGVDDSVGGRVLRPDLGVGGRYLSKPQTGRCDGIDDAWGLWGRCCEC